MIGGLLLWGALAWAGPAEDLARASNADLAEAERMDAFRALVGRAAQQQVFLEDLVLSPHADARQRWVAVRVLGQARLPGSLAVLERLLADPMPAVRAAAVAALADYGQGAAAITPLLEDPALMVRGAAADALGVLRDLATVPALAGALADPTGFYQGQSTWVRRHYVTALGDIGSRTAVDALVRALDDRDPGVVDEALVSLRKVMGYDYAEGRSREEHIQAWKRWWSAEQTR